MGYGLMRGPAWEQKLNELVDERRRAPFAWGRHDCALFAADAVQAVTGRDPAAAFRGRYRTAAGSVRALRRYGGGDLTGTATQQLGEPLASPLLAQRGDVCMVESGQGPMLGVCLGECLALPGERGLYFADLTAAQIAWRV